MDIWLAVVIGITQLFLGVMGVYVSLRPPKSEHHWYWFGGFVLVGLTGVGLTGWLATVGSREQKRNILAQETLTKKVEATNQALQTSLVEQARMSGHLEGIQTIMNNLSSSGVPGMKEVAQAVAQLAKQQPSSSTKLPLDILCQHLADCPSKELSKRATELASELEDIVTEYYKRRNNSIASFRAMPESEPNYAKDKEATAATIRAEEIMAMSKYREQYQSAVIAMKTVLNNRLGKHDTRVDFDYQLTSSDRTGNVSNMEAIMADLRRMAGEVLAMRQSE
jgi:hypothetical protein